MCLMSYGHHIDCLIDPLRIVAEENSYMKNTLKYNFDNSNTSSIKYPDQSYIEK